jgi:hypothetical protein
MSEIFGSAQAFLVAIDIVLFGCCIFGNSVLIHVICCEKNLRSKSSYNILSVAVADFAVGFIIIPTNLFVVSSELFSASENRLKAAQHF